MIEQPVKKVKEIRREEIKTLFIHITPWRNNKISKEIYIMIIHLPLIQMQCMVIPQLAFLKGRS